MMVPQKSHHRTFNLGNTTYPGMSCPYLRRESDPDEQYYLLNWYLDPEYTLYEGCECAKVRARCGNSKALVRASSAVEKHSLLRGRRELCIGTQASKDKSSRLLSILGQSPAYI